MRSPRVVATDWRETLERRLSDVFTVTTAATDGELSVEPADATVVITLSYTADPVGGVADAKALAEYVEGTYVQGLIPGYDYRGVAGDLPDRARTRGDQA
ncbi:MAG: DUF5813 family protein [Natrialbaceae archaeon]|nr:DUF5813 family protein [Natrialbaceae archaeon]